jgi:GTP-binding protein Era
LQTPQVSAVKSAGTKLNALAITPTSAGPVASPERLPRDMAKPPAMIPASASAGAPKENRPPITGIGVVKTPNAMLTSESTASRIEPTAMAARFRRAKPPVKRYTRPVSSHESKSGRCAIVGRPNVGKSTLLNALLGQKLAIATPKPQTTRTCILGVFVQKEPPLQIAFVDTPGLHAPENALGRALAEAAKSGLSEADVVVLVTQVNARGAFEDVLGPRERQLLEAMRDDARKLVLAINKVDRLKNKALLLPLIERCAQTHPFAAIVPISARAGLGLEGLVSEVGALMPNGLRYDAELLTDRPERFFAGELVREAVIHNTREELPYATAVVVEEFSDEGKLCRIEATIVVEKDSQKGIVIGKGGQRLKQIGTEARLELERLLGRKVFLKLWVKVLEGWTESPRRVSELLSADSQAVTPS